jgi:hypothetical protein
MDALKVLFYAAYFPDKKPRVHLFGTYTQEVKDMIEASNLIKSVTKQYITAARDHFQHESFNAIESLFCGYGHRSITSSQTI